MYFIIHLRSFFLTLIGTLMIIFSFAITGLIYEVIFRITYMSDLHNIVIFIVLGIAADDIFVFIDAWRQSESITVYRGDFKQRMSYTWRRAFKSTSLTSSTTTVAFLANIFSDQMPI